jgi:hypothetical protein
VPEAKAVLTGVTVARIDAIVYASNVPVGTYLAVEFELIDGAGRVAPAGGRTARRADLALDPASLALLDPGAGPMARGTSRAPSSRSSRTRRTTCGSGCGSAAATARGS